MAELAEKVERGAVQPHLPLMQRALLLCFKDMAWPAALAQDQDMFSGGEDWTLFSDAAATRFSAASYIRGDGCMDFGFSRWEAAQAEGFDAAPRLRESVWKCLPTIAQHIGKQTLKRYLDAFLRPLFADLSCGCALTEVAA
ncbi:uncharacterized protein HaLaN_28132, partial [Haematococcus lacustris]